MSWRFIVLHVLLAMGTFLIIIALLGWAFSAWGIKPVEDIALRARGYFRLAFAGFIGVLLLSAQALIGRKFRF